MLKITPMRHGRASRVTIPTGAHPWAKIAFSEMARGRATYDEVEHVSGVLRTTLKAWRRPGARPDLDVIDAVLGALGWRLSAVAVADNLPAALRRDLEGALARHGDTILGLAYLPEAAAIGAAG